ncbi:MAG TPA: chloride channel protein [Dehalococcoidia bacterium]|nr:chloride channel protein [Dehalococcoidia bacterium]
MSLLEETIDWLQRLSSRFSVSATTKGIAISILIGVVAGLGAVGFRWLIKGFQWLFFKGGSEAFSFMGDYYVIILPAIGGLIIGPLLYLLAREAKGEGPPEVIKALAVGGGHIRQRVAGVKMFASAICIGSGGSVGREGPIVQIGASFGSAIGQWFKLPDEWLKTFVLCGAAGGIAATFNAPVGGVFFALEVLAHRVVTPRLFTVMISAISAEYIAWLFLGPRPSFTVEEYILGSYWEILLYVLLGILAGLFAIGFIRVFYKCEDIFSTLKLPSYVKPAIGGLFVGIIGFFYADVFGVGYGGGYISGGVSVDSGPMDAMLAGQVGLGVLIALLFLKMIATSLTLGSGGSGGIFAPSLFIGAALGGVLGLAGGRLFPEVVSNAGAYSLVGMGAFFAAVVQGPITAIVLLLEMTRNISMLVPLMTSVVIATLTYRFFTRDSIYTMRLKRQGIEIRQGEADPVMKDITVWEAMTHDFPTVSPKMLVSELAAMLVRTGHHGFPVVDENGRLVGVVTLSDVESSRSRDRPDLKVEDIAIKSLFVAYPDQSMYDVLLKLGARDVGRIPVVERKDRTKLLGVLRRHDIIRAYSKKLEEDV